MPDSRLYCSDAAPVVLDSNIWIDILVFDDPATRPILAALEHASLHAVIDQRCRHELARVLDYPQFARFAVDREAALATVARLTTLHDIETPEALAAAAELDRTHGSLPRCSDPDDQKFLELSRATSACWLVTKDRALLKLNRTTQRRFGFSITLPQAFVAAHPLLAERPDIAAQPDHAALAHASSRTPDMP
ncbi:MAG: putative toxin-antitoxin system toxin component, PIN family [Janthinobacterium lividum]